MSTVKRTKDNIDVLEHTMQGVHTTANQGKIISFHAGTRNCRGKYGN
jgi:hypothetical protein